MAPFDLPRTDVKTKANVYQEISKVEPLTYVDRVTQLVHKYGQANAFIGLVENCRVIGHGSLVFDDSIIVHGVSSMNYEGNVRHQLRDYEEVPDGGYLEGEYVLVWGMKNFGHWLFTYLMRTAVLYWRSELLSKPLLIKEGTPKRFVELLRRMGFDKFVYAKDGVKVERLWVPSVVTYRGHYEDMRAYVFPQAVHLMRRQVLRNLEFPHPVRERIYLSRSKSNWRRVENEDELVSFLSAFGIHRVYLDELSIDRQLDLVSRAELIVVAAGGGSPMTMFAPVDCRIIELSIPKFAGTFASICWAHILGQKFYRVNGTPTVKTGELEIDTDFIIDTEKLSECLLDSPRV
jgi:capsular polysaccharide biosynthesis protein